MAERRLWGNNARAKLATAIVTTGPIATVVLEAGKGALFPSPVPSVSFFILTIENAAKEVECFKINARSGDILSVADSGSARAQEGTSVHTFDTTAICEIRVTKTILESLAGLFVTDAITALGALAPAQDRLPFFSGTLTASNTVFTAFARSLLDDVDAAAMRTTLGVTTDFQAGTRTSFNQTTAPSGWVKDTSSPFSDAALRVVTGSASSGGSNGFSVVMNNSVNVTGTAITIAQLPAGTIGSVSGTTSVENTTHIHNSTLGLRQFDGSASFGATSFLTTFDPPTLTTDIPSGTEHTNPDHTHSFSGSVTSSGSGQTHLHSFNLAAKFVDMIIAQKS